MTLKKQTYNMSKIILVSILLNIIQVVFVSLFIYYKNKNPYMIEGNFIIYVMTYLENKKNRLEVLYTPSYANLRNLVFIFLFFF
mgnify:CR=1 FL=1